MHTQSYKLNVGLLILFIVVSLIESFFVFSQRYWWYVSLYSVLATFFGTLIIVYIVCRFVQHRDSGALSDKVLESVPRNVRREIERARESGRSFPIDRYASRVDVAIMLLTVGFGVFVLVYVAYAEDIGSRIGWMISLAGLCGAFGAESLCSTTRK